MAQLPSKMKILAARLFSTLALWLIVTLVFKSDSRWAYGALAGVLSLIAYDEILRMSKAWIAPIARMWWRIVGLLYVLIVWSLYGAGYKLPDGLELLLLSIALLGAFFVSMRRSPDCQRTLPEVFFPLGAFVITPLLFFGSVSRLLFELPGDSNIPGAWYLMFVIAVTKFSDMGAYAVGSLIGKNKMIPHVSPAKTWEGFFGALFFAAAIGSLFYAAFPEELGLLKSWMHVIILALVLAVVAVIGDLVGSVIKRCLQVKDSGKFLPGIGGGFDLLDSMCFTIPVILGYIKFFLLAA